MSIENLPTLITFATVWIGGLIAVWGLFDQKLKARSKQQDDQEDRIIELYKTEVGVLKTKVDTYDNELKSMRNELSRIGGENKLLRDLVTGQDKDTMAWRGRTEQAMKLIEEIGHLAVSNGKKIDAVVDMTKTTNHNIERLAQAIEKSAGLSNTTYRTRKNHAKS